MDDGCVSQHTLWSLNIIYVKITVYFGQKDRSLPQNSMTSPPEMDCQTLVDKEWNLTLDFKSTLWKQTNKQKKNKKSFDFLKFFNRTKAVTQDFHLLQIIHAYKGV